MSNYPPGVTGNEPQIAGALAERGEDKECGQEATLPFTDENGKVWHITVDCPFEGKVDVSYWDRYGSYTWTCPLCQHEHEGERDDEPDPDEERDKWLDRD